MKKLIAIIVIFFWGIQIIIGQIDSNQLKNWDKIIINDSHNGWSHFNNEFQIEKKNLWLAFSKNPDSIIKKVRPELIDDFLKSLTTKKQIPKDPLLIFGKDSLWLMNNAEKLWDEYGGKNKHKSKKIDSIAIKAIKDYQKVKKIVWSLQGSYWTDDYPFIQISIITRQDTLFISSDGQYPFMMPWAVNKKSIYNHKIPTIIGKILPNSIKTNKPRLMGVNFNYYLIKNIYWRYIKNKVEFIRTKEKYPNKFKMLSKHFEILDAEMSNMASIEWGGWFGRPSLEIVLADSAISNKIRFSTVFSRRSIFHSPKSIVKNKDNLLKQLQGNPVYRYVQKCKKCIGEIHWVQSKSLSGEAKRNFLSDVKDRGLNKGKFRGKFKNAIFFELTEYRDRKRSFSRWIFFQNGTLVLWQLRGSFLMDLPDKYSKENGYICKEINRNEL